LKEPHGHYKNNVTLEKYGVHKATRKTGGGKI